jgi:hypothetical protein
MVDYMSSAIEFDPVAFAKGAEAKRNGIPTPNNPFKRDAWLSKSWLAGWVEEDMAQMTRDRTIEHYKGHTVLMHSYDVWMDVEETECVCLYGFIIDKNHDLSQGGFSSMQEAMDVARQVIDDYEAMGR